MKKSLLYLKTFIKKEKALEGPVEYWFSFTLLPFNSYTFSEVKDFEPRRKAELLCGMYSK